MVSTIERFHCIQDSQLGNSGVHCGEISLYTGQPAGSLRWMLILFFSILLDHFATLRPTARYWRRRQEKLAPLLRTDARTYIAPPPPCPYTHTGNSSHLMPKLLHKRMTKSGHSLYVLYIQCIKMNRPSEAIH